MQVILLILVTCELSWTIRVPVTWDEGESEVKKDTEVDAYSVESFKPQSDKSSRPSGKPIPVEYFEYTAKKPQFAADVAAFHGVQSPENHYKAYPIEPYTNKVKPELGKHRILDHKNTLHKQFQDYTKINGDAGHVTPVSSSYDVFHPYEAETPALEEIYKDPILNKIRSDLENSKNRLKQYEKQAGEPDITNDEYLESPEKTDGKLFPQRYRPAPFEIHRPQRRPIYYRPVPVYKHREQYLNHKLRHPWNNNIAKVRPMHYIPIKSHIHNLRQSHALKYDDERNEYPQVKSLENYEHPKDGYDIYEKGREKFLQLRNNVDESISKAVEQNRPEKYQKIENLKNESSSIDGEEEEEFVPIKNYAQVRRTETFRHLPKIAALDEAETYDEIKNAPRLREAIKSTKAQTVYSEEGYEDGAYDHAGELKHASEHEGHGGFLKERELSSGKYKTPSVIGNYEDGKGSTYRDQLTHADKWQDDKQDTKEEAEEEDYSENDHEHLLEAENYQTEPQNDDSAETNRNKRENGSQNKTFSNLQGQKTKNNHTEHEVDKREVNIGLPVIGLNSTFNKQNITKFLKLETLPKKYTIKQKYPYYFKNIQTINKNSPLRYAENLKFIPEKSQGGTEFYDSRSIFECPEVEDAPDPLPDKLKKDGHPDESDEKSQDESSVKDDPNFDIAKKQPRLKGLGDKIDCFKAKYFGENPLDSPFFKEDIISSPEPVFVPNIQALKLKIPALSKQRESTESKHDVLEKIQNDNSPDLFTLIEKVRNDQNLFKSFLNSGRDIILAPKLPNNQSNGNSSELIQHSSVYNDVAENIKSGINQVTNKSKELAVLDSDLGSDQRELASNVTYSYFQNKEDVTKPPMSRKKRATTFVYEPYKIIRDVLIQDDTKKFGAASPVIKQVQSSTVDIDTNMDETQHVKRNVNTRAYKDIYKKDREIKLATSKNDRNHEDSEIVDVSVDKRRGEPRYEIKPVNHKSRYTPVKNVKSMTKENYEAQVENDKENVTQTRAESGTTRPTRLRRPITEKAYFDITKFIPRATDVQNVAASNTVRKKVSSNTSTPNPQVAMNNQKSKKHDEESRSDEDYEDYDVIEEEEAITSSRTTTTLRPAFRSKTRTKVTTQQTPEYTEEPRLKLVTRFREYQPKESHDIKHPEANNNETTFKKRFRKQDENITPKFREKKKKVTKSTLVTDTKKYGDDDDDMQKHEIDAMIGNTHDMDDYVPLYEKKQENEYKQKTRKQEDLHNMTKSNTDNVNLGHEKDGDGDGDDDDDDDDDDDADDDDYDDHDDDDDDEVNGDDINQDGIEVDEGDGAEEENDNENEDSTIDEEEEQEQIEQEQKATTSEPTKMTLVITTEAPIPTTASRSTRLQQKPKITRKKIEIHKELPVNKSSPHITQFKQDIKEIEIIKETPQSSRVRELNPLKRKPNKNVEVLDLYKDDNLPKDINKLSVEIFKENLDLRTGPKHGGNYRKAEPSDLTPETLKHPEDDAEASQSQYKKDIKDEPPSKRKISTAKNRARNSELIELLDPRTTSLHGGNLKYHSTPRKTNRINEKLVELDEEYDQDYSSDSREDESYSSSRSGPRMHGGNYRSAKIIEEKQPEATQSLHSVQSKDTRRNAALVLNSFAQAAPVLMTTPGYIVDPSKRKYYYVDV